MTSFLWTEGSRKEGNKKPKIETSLIIALKVNTKLRLLLSSTATSHAWGVEWCGETARGIFHTMELRIVHRCPARHSEMVHIMHVHYRVSALLSSRFLVFTHGGVLSFALFHVPGLQPCTGVLPNIWSFSLARFFTRQVGNAKRTEPGHRKFGVFWAYGI